MADPVVAAAGDIACDPANSNFAQGEGTSRSCRARATSDLLLGGGLSAVLTLGDNQYYCGAYRAWQSSYDASWGRVKAITHPAVGNHEYVTHGSSNGSTGCTSRNAGAAGYFDYFNGVGQKSGPAGARGSGYYSIEIGSWHLIALNSSCSEAGGCGATSPQGRWLRSDLANHPDQCTLAYWHIPLFSSGGRAARNTRPFWELLQAAGADLVLTGHDHVYERFAPQRADGTPDEANGLREFVVGTGGANHTSFVTQAPNSEVRSTGTYGVLMLTLHPTSYTWRFQPEAGKTFTDSGHQACHRAKEPAPPPAPTQAARQLATPKIRLLGNGARRAIGRRAVLVRVACPDEACTAAARGTILARRARGRSRLRSASANVGAGREARLELQFSRAALRTAMRALARRRTLIARVSVAVRYDSGQTFAVRRTIRLTR